MLLQEEILDYRHQLLPRLSCRLGAGCGSTARWQHAHVVEAKQQHHRRQYQHHRHPCMPGSLVADCLCGTLHPTETYQQGTCQPDQPAGRHNLRYIVETPGFVHAKEFISDDCRATVGTVNLDFRSLYLHFECGAYIYKNDVVADIENDYQKTLEKCQKITEEDCKKYPWHKKLIGQILRLLAPLM